MVSAVLYNASAEEIKAELAKTGTVLRSYFIKGFVDITQEGDTWPRYEFTDINPEFYALFGVIENDGSNGEIIAEFDKYEDAHAVACHLF